jgi:hypothetical protein
MATGDSGKRRIYIVGGKGKNVPPWITAAFDWEQFEQDHSKTRTLEPDKAPNAVVVLSSWVGHEHFYGARDLADRLGIPMILSPGGWSASLKAAAEMGINWFINDIDRSREAGDLTESEVEDLDVFIDNAWREAYNREWSARQAIERRYGKARSRFEHAERELQRLTERDAAAQRVIAEVRTAATAQRRALEEARAEADRKTQEIQDRSERVAATLVDHIESLNALFDVADRSHASVLRASASLNDVRRIAQRNLDTLRASLTIAEDGLPTITEDMEERDTNPVSAFNPGTDS